MNKRIKGLAEQAKFMTEETINKQISKNAELDKFAEKFAELIVGDVVNIMKQEWYDLNNAPKAEGETPRDVGLRVGAKSQTLRLLHMVKKHFGVDD